MKSLIGVLIAASLSGSQQASLQERIALFVEHGQAGQLVNILDQLPSAIQPGLVPDLWMLYDYLQQEDNQFRAASVAQEICRLGDRDDFEALLQRRPALSTVDDQKRLLLALCQCRLGERIQELSPLVPAQPEPLADVELPEHLAAASSELQEAYRLYRAFSQMYLEALDPQAASIDLPPNWDLFLDTVESLLRGEGVSWEEI